jgi:hypothetical protein
VRKLACVLLATAMSPPGAAQVAAAADSDLLPAVVTALADPDTSVATAAAHTLATAAAASLDACRLVLCTDPQCAPGPLSLCQADRVLVATVWKAKQLKKRYGVWREVARPLWKPSPVRAALPQPIRGIRSLYVGGDSNGGRGGGVMTQGLWHAAARVGRVR